MSPVRPAAAGERLRHLVAAIEPVDGLEREHRDDALGWLDATDDVYRRVRPATPPKHLGAYALMHDPRADAVLLLHHRLSGLWLPAGGHVEVDEDPGETAVREAAEELGRTVGHARSSGPLFLSVTTTTSRRADRHVDVSLWYVLRGDAGWQPVVDAREAYAARWWSRTEVAAADPARLDPHLGRCLAKL